MCFFAACDLDLCGPKNFLKLDKSVFRQKAETKIWIAENAWAQMNWNAEKRVL